MEAARVIRGGSRRSKSLVAEALEQISGSTAWWNPVGQVIPSLEPVAEIAKLVAPRADADSQMHFRLWWCFARSQRQTLVQHLIERTA